MRNRLAASLALVAFAMCLFQGMHAGNTFGTTVLRAMLAMVGTYVIGLIVGLVGQKMIDENVKAEEEKLRNSGQKLETSDR